MLVLADNKTVSVEHAVKEELCRGIVTVTEEDYLLPMQQPLTVFKVPEQHGKLGGHAGLDG